MSEKITTASREGKRRRGWRVASEQSSGVSQVGDAVVQMDQGTQQNAALVEEMNAAAIALKQQAQDLLDTVGIHPTTAEEFTLLTTSKSSGAATQKTSC